MRLAFVAYALALAALAGLVLGPAERLWPLTLFLFGPRWIVALPFPFLLLLSALVDRRVGVLLGLASAGMLVFLVGFNVPWSRLLPAAGASGPAIRVLTWNLGGGLEAGPRPVAWVLEKTRPDVAVLQECAASRLEQPGEWHRRRSHGLCVLSRFPIQDVAVRDPSDMWRLAGSGEIVRYALDTPIGLLEITNVHLETPREGIEAILGSRLAGVPTLEAKYAQRELETRAARRWVDAGTLDLRLVAGDFNTPVESNLFREHWRGFRDCHSSAGWGVGATKRTRRIGTRIDHVLAGPGLQCTDVQVGPWVGGDHAPLAVTVRLAPR